jgi:hypothetical protein
LSDNGLSIRDYWIRAESVARQKSASRFDEPMRLQCDSRTAGANKAVCGPEEVAEIRLLVPFEGKGKGSGCGQFGLHRDTLVRILVQAEPPGQRQKKLRGASSEVTVSARARLSIMPRPVMADSGMGIGVETRLR